MSGDLALTMDDSEVIASNGASGNVPTIGKKKQVRVEMKTYALKEVDALRKKLSFAKPNKIQAILLLRFYSNNKFHDSSLLKPQENI